MLERLFPMLLGAEQEATIARMLAEIVQAQDRHPARHRAVDDVEQEWQEWLIAGWLAEAAGRGLLLEPIGAGMAARRSLVQTLCKA